MTARVHAGRHVATNAFGMGILEVALERARNLGGTTFRRCLRSARRSREADRSAPGPRRCLPLLLVVRHVSTLGLSGS